MILEMCNNAKDAQALVIYENHELPENTILLPEKIYSEYNKDKFKYMIVKFPFDNYGNLRILPDYNVSSTTNDYCEVSLDVHRSLNLDFNGDVVRLLVLNNDLKIEDMKVIRASYN